MGSLKELTKNTNIYILENDFVTIEGVNFLGCTLWTNFELFGNTRISGYECQQVMTDYKKIRRAPNFAELRSIDTLAIHGQSVRWLEQTLKEHQGENNVVVTHHGPSQRSVPEKYQNNVTTAAYVSNLEKLIQKNKPNYWLHGHLHNSSDYVIDRCRILSNPRGYPDSLNSDFKVDYCINI